MYSDSEKFWPAEKLIYQFFCQTFFLVKNASAWITMKLLGIIFDIRHLRMKLASLNGGWHEKIKNIFALKSLLRVVHRKNTKNFWKIRTRSNSLTFTRRFWLLQSSSKAFPVRAGYWQTSRGKRLLARPIATDLLWRFNIAKMTNWAAFYLHNLL